MSKTGKEALNNVITGSGFHKPSGRTLDDVNRDVAKETSHLSKGTRPESDYRPSAPSPKGKLGAC